ncbi:MAG: hypothetical protein COU08_03725 [Candidatus Harrisonbacteria bacterium CG10_big_fil_rev_8_21_14_0_10_42_17]|uniref:Type II secretion system protein GspF domain-containing protein n=1 Tax=Candidatus Harrisonbacteria bacterium CG10_big_fil_rev_8_21_14_0_10_42_17 TaxID=1974584 RepID=A0A2M6WHE9_9BACT|nr:MAG: hypothetical protein COU08_03725 [Candidatus Harrisonbacteria bacterium CG10_big_fil_rev_8_21_14_0_10_42_17]
MIRPLEQSKKKKGFLESDISIGGVGLTQIGLFAKNVAVMLKAGLPITEALTIAEDSAQGKFKKILQKILKSVEAGRPFSASLKLYPKVFSNLFVNAVYAGELSGNLEENLDHIADQLEKEKEIVTKVKSAMIYPIFILIATFIMGLALAFFVLPQITPLFKGLKVELPITTKVLIWISDATQAHGIAIFSGIVIAITALLWVVKREWSKPVTHWLLLKTPFIKGITRNANLARFCRTLGTLLKSGISIDRGVEITKNTAENYYYRKALDTVSRRIGKGTTLSENLNVFEKEFPKLVTRMIRVGEESGKLEETLLYLASYYEIEVDTATKRLATAIEPSLLIIIGLAVAGLALSIITPIYEITGNIER